MKNHAIYSMASVSKKSNASAWFLAVCLLSIDEHLKSV